MQYEYTAFLQPLASKCLKKDNALGPFFSHLNPYIADFRHYRILVPVINAMYFLMEDKTEKVTESEFDRALLACLVIFSKEAARINGKEIFNVNFLKLFQFLAEGDDVNDLNELERKYEQILFPDGQNRPYGDQVFFHEIIKNHRLDEDKTVVSYLNRYKEELSLPNLMVQWPAKKLWSLSLFRPAQNKTCCPVKEELQSCAASSAEMQHSKISTGKEKSHSFFNVQPQPEHSTQQDDFANHQKLR